MTLVAVVVACGSAPSLTLVGPNGAIAGVQLSECVHGIFASGCGDAVPTAPPTVHVTGAGGANFHVETNAPGAQMFVQIEQGTFENRRVLQAGSKQRIAAIHLDPSGELYFVTINLDSGSGSITALFVIKVDAPVQ
ncbi:MAG: hypothetical protein M3037_15150 [Gemmatimonadota bacterium]|nr:hypothetical protein [Gemmatimonadota bacterium]